MASSQQLSYGASSGGKKKGGDEDAQTVSDHNDGAAPCPTGRKSGTASKSRTCPHCSKVFSIVSGLAYHLEHKVCQRETKDDARWKNRLGELRQYSAVHGHCNVPQHCSENKPLGKWVSYQRQQYQLRKRGKKSFVTDERIAALEGLGFQWTLYASDWDERFEDLRRYKAKHGHCKVSTCDSASKQLGEWVGNQRKQYRRLKKGKTSPMTDGRIAALESIGLQWAPAAAAAPQKRPDWETRFEELKQYKAKNGHCNVPQQWSVNKQLGTWVHNQRKRYQLRKRGEESSMTDERIAALESVGFRWDNSAATTAATGWEARLAELRQYKADHGHCNIPQGYRENKPLANWVMNQRNQYRVRKQGKKSSLTDERIAALESAGLQWVVSPASVRTDWDDRFEELRAYKVQHRNCNVPQRWKENIELGRWVKFQRAQYRLQMEGKKSSMTDERVTKLNSIGFKWTILKSGKAPL